MTIVEYKADEIFADSQALGGAVERGVENSRCVGHHGFSPAEHEDSVWLAVEGLGDC
jgi:hypothetical protein